MNNVTVRNYSIKAWLRRKAQVSGKRNAMNTWALGPGAAADHCAKAGSEVDNAWMTVDRWSKN